MLVMIKEGECGQQAVAGRWAGDGRGGGEAGLASGVVNVSYWGGADGHLVLMIWGRGQIGGGCGPSLEATAVLSACVRCGQHMEVDAIGLLSFNVLHTACLLGCRSSCSAHPR